MDNGATTQKWETEYIHGKMEILIQEVSFLIKEKEKEIIYGEMGKRSLAGGKIINSMEILPILLKETLTSSKFLTDK